MAKHYDNRGIKREPMLWSPVDDHDNYPYETDTPSVEDDIVANLPADPMNYAPAGDSAPSNRKGK